jgi:hypothetical protein
MSDLNRKTLRAHMRAMALEFRQYISPGCNGPFDHRVKLGSNYVKHAITYRDLSHGKIPA